MAPRAGRAAAGVNVVGGGRHARARRGADQGRGQRHHRGRVCAARLPLREGSAGERARLVPDHGGEFQEADRDFGRPAQLRRAPIISAPRASTRRHRDPHRADAQYQVQHHPRRRTVLSRSAAGELERRHARPAARGGRGTRQPRARSRTPVAPAAPRRQAAAAAADPRQGRDPADFHALRIRHAGNGQCRARAQRRQSDARIRPADPLGPGRR